MKWWQKIASRKFMAWVAGTVALYLQVIDGWQWLALTVIWIGGNSIDKLISLKRTGGTGEENKESTGISD